STGLQSLRVPARVYARATGVFIWAVTTPIRIQHSNPGAIIMDTLTGGFLIHRAQPILRGLNGHTCDLPGRPISDVDLQATNRLQETPWRVNRGVLFVAQEMQRSKGATLVPGSD